MIEAASGLDGTVQVPFREEEGAVLLFVRLTPKGGRDGFDGMVTGADGKVVLQARVRAVPEDGAANAALIALVAKTLKLRKADIALVSGATARQKSLRLSGDPATLSSRLAALCAVLGSFRRGELPLRAPAGPLA
jgi:uncharacterized protein